MPRWRSDGAERLEEAAASLFSEQGYDATSVAQIAARAGLTQRTFYNHFPDKREALFGLSAQFEAETVQAFRSRENTLAPLEAVVDALKQVCESMFEDRRAAIVRRQGIISANRELQERDAHKQAALREALSEMLCQSGLGAEAAALTAGASLLVLQSAIGAWLQPAETRSLRELLDRGVLLLRRALEPEARGAADAST